MGLNEVKALARTKFSRLDPRFLSRIGRTDTIERYALELPCGGGV